MTADQMAAGRMMGAPLGGKALVAKPAPDDCPHCRMMGYTRWHQHIGHLGFNATMEKSPETLKVKGFQRDVKSRPFKGGGGKRAHK